MFKQMNVNTGKKILLVTRPIAPPWDEASKNFAYFLAKNVKEFEFNLLTNGTISGFSSHIKQWPIYDSNHLNWRQKINLLKVMRFKKNFDIMHFMLTPNKLNAFAFKTFFGSKAKTIQTIATLREDLFKDPDFRKILFADLIITYSDHAKNKLVQLGFENVKRIYPGIDLEYYSLVPKDPDLMKQWNISGSDFVITYPGEYVRLGATDDLIQMIIENKKEFKSKNIKIVFACRVKNGDDSEKKQEAIEKLTREDALDRVVFTDTYSDMAKLYNLSDIVIFPVRNMQGKFDVPLAAIEPMACEKPVIISDLPILQEFAKNDNSVIIKTGDFKELVTAIFDLQKNPEKRISLGKAARKFTEENFDIKKVAEKYREVYMKI